MELTSYFGKTAEWITTHYDPKTNAGKAVFIEFEEGAQLMVVVEDKRRDSSSILCYRRRRGVPLSTPTLNLKIYSFEQGKRS